MEYRKICRAWWGLGPAAALAVGLFILAAAVPGAAGAAAGDVTVAGLTVDHMTAPSAIEDVRPTFGWKLESTARGVSQTAYQVQVADDEADLATGKDLWDSGRVESSESVEAPYEGPSPAAGRDYVWRVRAWDQDDQATEWSAPASWQTALLDQSEWGGAQWITPKATTESANWTDYRLDLDFSIASGAAGVVFRERDPDDFYMWQIQVQPEVVLLRPHVMVAGRYRVLDEIPLEGVLAPGEASATHHLTIVADGSTITTTIDGTKVDERADPTLASGGIGFRSGSPGEDASFSGLTVEEIGGGRLFTDDFAADPDPAFPGAEIESGSLRDRNGALDLISSTPTAPLLRRSFTLQEPLAQVSSARAYAFGLGLYEMRLSGQKVGDRVFTPPVTDYSSRLRYQTYDVTSRLREGENVVGMTLAEGYGPSFSSSGLRWLGPREAKAMVEIRYRDGSVQRVVTDESWRWSEGSVISAGIYAGETYDARRAREGWDEPGFDASDWQPVAVAAAPGGRLEADTTPPVRVVAGLHPVAVTQPAGSTDTYVFDFGEEVSGWARLAVAGEPGGEIQLTYAEDLAADGHVDTTTNGLAEATDRYLAAGTGPETFEPTFTYHGFRYVEVTGLPSPPTASTLTAQVVHADLPRTASFESSDPLLDAIFEENRRTMINNAMSYPTDNPVRNERTGPGMDVQAYADAATRVFAADRFFAPFAEDIAGSVGSPDMNEAAVPLAWDLYEQYGDRRALEATYPGMVTTMRNYGSRADLVWPESPGFGDWCAPVPPAQANGGVGSGETGGYFVCFDEVSLVNTALAYRNARIVAAAAEALGKGGEAAEFEELAERIEAAFEARFAGPDGYGSEGRQVSDVLPLAFGMVPAGRTTAVSEALVDQILGPDEGHLDTGIFGTRFLVDALVAAGRPDVALEVLDQTTYPSFGYELGFGAQIGLPPGHGATTDWEEWTYRSGMESHDHAMFAGIDASFLTKFAGIEPTAPGYAKIRVDPVTPGGLERAAGSIETVRGEVASSWRRQGEGFALDVTVPGNATAEIALPVREGQEVRESGRPIDAAPDVTFLREEGGKATYEVGSGEYHFTAGPPVVEPPDEEGDGSGEEKGGQGQSGGEDSGHGSGGGGGSGPGSPGGDGRGPHSSPAGRPKLKASARLTRRGPVTVAIVCTANCPAGEPKLGVIASGPSGRPVLARVRKRLVHGRLSFNFVGRDGKVPARLRLAVTGLAPTKIVLDVKLSR